MTGRAVRGRIGTSPDAETLYPKHIDSGAARVVTLCFGFCSALCFLLFYLVLSLAIIPEMGTGDWQQVKCRAKHADVASEPSRECRGKGDVNCDVETDPERPTPGGLWEERCHDTSGVDGACVRHVWANILLEWERPGDDHRRVNPHVDRMAEGMHETVGRMIHKKEKAARTQKYLSVCYPYRCGGTESAVLARREVAEAQALSFVHTLRNASGLPITAGMGIGDDSGQLELVTAASGTGVGSSSGVAPAAVAAPGTGKEKAKAPLPVKGLLPKEQRLGQSVGKEPFDGGVNMHKPGAMIADRNDEKKLIDLTAAPQHQRQPQPQPQPQPVEQQRHTETPSKATWRTRECSYSRTFYATVPGISPLRRGANAAVYFKTPTGYVDLPGGVTLWSVLTLLIFGGCTVGQLCCLYSQCKAYGYGGLGRVFDPKHSKSR